ncbi:MAG: hypothetical protein JO086_02175 [Acidimicrobiia bacterium]|nr:hypothetical protein [Acidimicrobiia bacterium]
MSAAATVSTDGWTEWMHEWVAVAEELGIDSAPETMLRKVAEEVGEFLVQPSVNEAIDVLATVVLWAARSGTPPDELLCQAWARLQVWRRRTYVRQPDGTYHHV